MPLGESPAAGPPTAGPSTLPSSVPKIRLNLQSTSSRSNGKQPARHLSDSSDLTSDYDQDDEDEHERVVSAPRAQVKGVQRSPETVKKPTPGSREKKRKGRKEAVERSRARADKLRGESGNGGNGGGDGDVDMDDGQQTPRLSHQRHQRIPTQGGSGKQPKSKRTNANGRVHSHETHGSGDEEDAALPSAFNGQEVEDLDYGQGEIDEDELEMAVQGRDWWEDEEEDEEEEEENLFITNLSDSEIAQLASQSSASDSGDDSLSDTDTDDSSDDVDAFGFPMLDSTFPPPLDASGQPLILMEDWDGNFVLVQPKPEDTERSRSRSRGERRSRTGGSTTAGEQLQLIVDSEAMETDSSDDDCDYGDDESGGDTTDSMAEEDMPSLPSVSPERFLAAIPTGQETALAQDLGVSLEEAAELLAKGREQEMLAMASAAAAAVADGDAAMMDVDNSSVPSGSTPADSSAPLLTPALSTSASESAPVVPLMGSFRPLVSDPASHAVIDGSSKATPSPFTRRRARPRGNSTSTAASASTKPRKERVAPYSSYGTPGKARYSSIPGHPRYIAAAAAAHRLQMQHDCGDRESTPSEPESDPEPMSLEDMLDASMLVHQSYDAAAVDVPGGEEHLRHLIRFDRVPVSTYRQRNYNFAGNASRDRNRPLASGALSPQASVPNHLFSPTAAGRRASTLTETLAGSAARMVISPLLGPVIENDDLHSLSRKERRRERRGRRQEQSYSLPPLQI